MLTISIPIPILVLLWTSNSVIANTDIGYLARSFDNGIAQQQQQQIRTNTISTNLLPGEPDSIFQKLVKLHGGMMNSNGYRRRGYLTRPRTVESPALSVDSGGKTSGSIADAVAKILEVKQGYYSDIYDKIDKPNTTTKRPADALEDSIRVAVARYLAKRFYQHPSQEMIIANNHQNLDNNFKRQNIIS